MTFNRENDGGETITQEIMTLEQFWAMIEREGWLKEENKNENLDETEVKVSLKVNDLDFPFLLYHDEMLKAKLLPENFMASELKQIAKRLRGLIGEVPLSELIYQVTDQYCKDFEFFINSKPILGMKSRVEEIKSKDVNLYDMIMNYQVTLVKYIESFHERKLQEIRGKLNIFNISLKEEPKPNISMVARITPTGIDLINESNS